MNNNLRNTLMWTAYPSAMGISLALYYGLYSAGFNLTISSFIAAMIGGFGLITLLEIVIPYRKEWRPTKEEIRTDIIFLLLIQAGLPKLLTLLTTFYLIEFTKIQGWQLEGLWPHHWPTWIQMLFMMFIADFFRYWLHRAAHQWILLWRVHAVHHSVQKLYWVNVGRFHPIDKSLQFIVEIMPFIFLGVSFIGRIKAE